MNIISKTTFRDLSKGILNWRIWLLLGWQDIRLRYRRSHIGPFWITISMAITIYTMGFLYGTLFKIDLRSYFPLLASGMLTWTLLSSIIIESTSCLVEASGYLKQIKIPPIVFVFRIISRNFIIFAHNLVALIPIVLYFHISIGWNILAILFGLLIIAINATAYGFILGMLGARFRDIPQIVVSLMQVIFFLTPVIWESRVLPEKYQFLAKFNPFTQFINLIRTPLTGNIPTSYDYLMTGTLAITGMVLMFIIFHRVKNRIIYWL